MIHIGKISEDQAVLGGVPVFSGTRVPVRALWEYLESGETLGAFLSDFPAVSREQAVGVLEAAKDTLLHARPH